MDVHPAAEISIRKVESESVPRPEINGYADSQSSCDDSSPVDLPDNLVNGCKGGGLLRGLDGPLNGVTKGCTPELLSSRLSELSLRTVQSGPEAAPIPRDVPSTSCDSEIPDDDGIRIEYVGYESEVQMPDIMRLIQKDLSEPYSIYTYRYFIHNWPNLCFLAHDRSQCVGAIVCKLDVHKKQSRRGYIAMLAVDEHYRKRKIGSNLVLKAIKAMVQDSADEVVLETEITNKPALRLYENLGFVRDKRLFRYYLNGVDALRLKLWLR